MTRRKRAGRDDADSNRDRRVDANGTPWLRQYGVLAVACVGIAVVIATVAAYFTPLKNPPLDATEAAQLPDPPDPRPTIGLPAAPAEVVAEELRGELLQLGNDLRTRFPQVPEALHVAALLYADLQKTAEAEKIWRQCLELAPQQPGPYIGLATAAMELGKDEEAVATLRKALDVGCSSPDLYHQLALALTKLGRLDEAAATLETALGEFPRSPENWLQLGQVQLQQSRFAEAETSLKKALEQGTTDGSVYFSLATACARQDKQDEAAGYRQQFSQRQAARDQQTEEGFQARYDAELRQIAVATTCRAGTVYDRQGDPAKAEQLLRRALELDPANAVVCVELAALYRRQGRIADARLVTSRLVQIEPQIVMHHVNLASLSSQLADYATAESALKHVITVRPDLSIGYLSLAQLYLQTGNVQQARWFAEAALQQQSTGEGEAARAYVVLAAACEQMGDRDAAAAALAQARQLTPNDPVLPRPGPDSP